jgi:hypothetical protein
MSPCHKVIRATSSSLRNGGMINNVIASLQAQLDQSTSIDNEGPAADTTEDIYGVWEKLQNTRLYNLE